MAGFYEDLFLQTFQPNGPIFNIIVTVPTDAHAPGLLHLCFPKSSPRNCEMFRATPETFMVKKFGGKICKTLYRLSMRSPTTNKSFY